MPPVDIFLSFRGADRELARAIDGILTASGYNVWFYPRSSPGGSYFPHEINEALKEAKKILVVLTPSFYYDSLYTKGEFDYALDKGKLLVLRFEGAEIPPLATGLVHQECDLTPDDERFAEVVLAAANGTPVDGCEPAKRIEFGLIQRITSSSDFEGRQEEIVQLDKALADKECSIVCVIAPGGFGKSTLVKEWLNGGGRGPGSVRKVISSGYAYSFAGQGAGTQTTLSSDAFFLQALRHFRGVDPVETDPATYPKALLAVLCQQRRPLLVLDGLEPFQNDASEASPGEIYNKALLLFVDALIHDAKATTTVITSRIVPSNLLGHLESGRVRIVVPSAPTAGADPSPVRSIDLGKLERSASVGLLRACLKKVKEAPSFSSSELEAFAEECDDHPLLLSLVGAALADGHYDLQQLRRNRDPGDEQKHDLSFAGAVDRLVKAQLDRLGNKAKAVLYSVCLFDEPVDGKSLRDLLIEPAKIPVFTEPLRQGRSFSGAAFREGARKLEKAAILIPEKGAELEAQSHTMDWTFGVHPVIQAGIRMTLAEEHKQNWRKANETIYRSLLRSVKTRQPSKKEELRRLYAAVPHGVRAGLGPQAGWMYGKRCQRGYRAYATNQHGMIGDDVEAMSHYFVGRWSAVRDDIGMRNFHKGIAYSWAGLVLIGTNQLVTGLRLMEAGIEYALKAGAYVTASRTSRHLAFISALLGSKDKALKLADDAIKQLRARRPPWIWLLDLRLIIMPHQRMTAHANLGSVHHYFGDLKQAEEWFQKAEVIQAAAQPRYPKLRAIWGYRYADLLLDLGRFDEAEERFTSALVDPDEPKGWGEGVFAAPLIKLGFIRSKVRQADHGREKRDWDKVTAFSRELETFGTSGGTPDGTGGVGHEADTQTKSKKKKDEYRMRLDVLTPAFRSGVAGVQRLEGNLEGAMSEITEAERSAKIAGTCLFNVEIAVERARILLAMGARDEALDVLARVLDAIPHVAYRRAELERLLAEFR